MTEHLVYAIDLVQRRWRMFLLPILITLPIAAASAWLSPKKYTSTAIVLLQGSNSGNAWSNSSPSASRDSVLQQISALDAWIKSDEVLGNLLPNLVDAETIATPEGRTVQMRILRNRITLELIGSSVLEIRLEGGSPKQLGRKVEAIVSRLMHGLTSPEPGIMNATQFLYIRQAEDAAAAEAALTRAIEKHNFDRPDLVRAELAKLHELKTSGYSHHIPTASTVGPNAPRSNSTRSTTASPAPDTTYSITDDPAVLAELESIYAAFANAQDAYRAAKSGYSETRTGNYVGIFDAPERLMLVGRPQDPLFGERSGAKIAIAFLLLSFLVAGGLVAIFELFDSTLRRGQQFSDLSGLPVIARLPNLGEQRPSS